MKTITRIALIGLYSIVLISIAQAQNERTDSKRQLILELIVLTGEADEFKTHFKRGMDDQRRIFQQNFDLDSFGDASLPAEERKANQEKMLASMNRMYDRISERVLKETDFEGFANRTLIQIYDKHYSEDEIRELIVFYRSPAGKKALRVGPTILSDIMKAFEVELLPGIMKITKEITDEEMKEVLKDLKLEIDESIENDGER